MLEIKSNGNKWIGTDTPWRTVEPETIEALVEVLKQYPLDPSFEKYGNFIDHNPQFIKPAAQAKYAGCTAFFGNFYTYSHVFRIYTDEPEVIEMLSTAIRANLSTKEYRQAREEYKQAEEKREAQQAEYLLKEQLKQARELYDKVQPVVNGMEAWIISSPWGSGIGLRYYPIGQGYKGMTETVETGIVKLIEKL